MNFLIRKKKSLNSTWQVIKYLTNDLNENYIYLEDSRIDVNEDIILIDFSNTVYIRELLIKDSTLFNPFEINGLFYLILLNHKNNSLKIYTNIFGILPLYVSENENEIVLSNSIPLIKSILQKVSINKKFILEQNLFNYSFGQRTIYNEICLVPCGAEILVSDKLIINKYFNIEDYFTDHPLSRKKSINELTDIFIEINRKFIKDNSFISFTSGFDGRTIVAVAKYLKKNFSTYSFGSRNNIDLFLPAHQAKNLGLNFLPIKLYSENYLDEYWQIANDVILSNGATTNFLQVHWAYSAKILANYTDTVIQGIFGSELLRAAHMTGQFTSPFLFLYFKSLDNRDWISSFNEMANLKFLNLNTFTHELDELKEELIEYKKSIKFLNQNQQYYKYIFDEIFRKFFGFQFVGPQARYLNVIVPYLSPNFVFEILKTEFAGVNNKFYTHNPFNRWKGQLLYSEIIQKCMPSLALLETGKGYRPIDLLSVLGKLNIVGNYLLKRTKRRLMKVDLDNLSILSAYSYNLSKFNEIKLNDVYFNAVYLNELSTNCNWVEYELIRNKYLETLSLNLYLDKH